MSPTRLALLLLPIAAALPGCGGSDAPSAPKPPAGTAPAKSAADRLVEPHEVTVRHVLYAYKGASRSRVGRTKEQARLLARSAIEDLQKGRSFDEVVLFTDDQQADGSPNPRGGPPGQYAVSRGIGFAEPFVEAAFSIPLGKVAPEPVETEFGFHVMTRVK